MTSAEPAEEAAPSYQSPSDQLQETLGKLGLNPMWGFRQLFESLNGSKGGGGGRFEFSPTEMRELHRQFEDEAEALKKMREKNTDASNQLKPLAEDPASKDHYQAALQHRQKLAQAIEQQYQFAEGFREAVDKAIKHKAQGEDEGRARMQEEESKLS